MPPVPELIAHRGAPRERRENTIASFAAALARGADAIELDVHFTRDHVPVVHHDPVLGPGATRHAGERVDALDAAAVVAVEVEPGLTIPTLGDVCDAVAGRATLYVEIKAAASDADLARVHDVLRSAPATSRDRFALHAFDYDVARRSAVLAPDVATGILREHAAGDAVIALRGAHARDLWQHWTGIDAALVVSVHRARGRVIAWTVNDAAEARRVVACGVDAICTDDVPLIRAALAPSAVRAGRSMRITPAP